MGITANYRSRCWACGVPVEKGEIIARKFVCEPCLPTIGDTYSERYNHVLRVVGFGHDGDINEFWRGKE